MSESTPDRPDEPTACCRAADAHAGAGAGARAAGRSCGSGCGRRWPRSRPRRACSSRCPGSDSGLCCRRSAVRSVLVGFFVLAVAAVVPLFLVRGAERARRLAPARPGEPHAAPSGDRDRRQDGARGRRSVCGRALARHVERALRAARALKAGPPQPLLAMRDPFALRALVLVLVVASFFAAGCGSNAPASPRRSTGTAW